MIQLGEDFRSNFFNLFSSPGKEKILFHILKLSREFEIHIVGGAVRDALLGRPFSDLDLVVDRSPETVAKILSEELGYALVDLAPEFGLYRVANPTVTIDVSLRRGASMEEDLADRDYTINTLAIPAESLFSGKPVLVDPFSGYADLKNGSLRAISEKNLRDDPLRILRGYRFFAQGYGKLEEMTRQFTSKNARLLGLCASERLLHELDMILLTSKSYDTFLLMDEDSVLEVMFPEIVTCKGVPQPEYHHLDVWGHMLESLKWAEQIVTNPQKFLEVELPDEVLRDRDFVLAVKLGSFFHDLGKGYTFNRIDDRILFYGHERVSEELVLQIASRLRFKKDLSQRIALLVKNHMRPCHLLAEYEAGRLSVRAKRKLIKDVPHLWDLMVVALADSLASQGLEKERDYEERLKRFFLHLFSFKEDVEKIERKNRLLTGNDLIELGFVPGPIFKEILIAVELKTLEGEVQSREEAIEFVLRTFGQSLSCKRDENKVS